MAKYTSANRNNKLEAKIDKITTKYGLPPGYLIGYGSQTKGGKESPLLIKPETKTKLGEAVKIKGKIKNTKQNIVDARSKLEGKPPKALQYKPKSTSQAPVIPVKNGTRISNLGRGAGGLGGGGTLKNVIR